MSYMKQQLGSALQWSRLRSARRSMSLIHCLRFAYLGVLALSFGASQAQESKVLPLAPAPTPEPGASASAKPAPPPNPNWQRYEINQAFQGRAYEKDHHVWVYDREFAELFGMPVQYIEPIVGAVAAAYRIENMGHQLCGLGGVDSNCMVVEDCRLDLYFDESKTPLPWATTVNAQWEAEHGSLRWLKPQDPKEKPGSMLALDPPPDVLRSDGYSRLIAFADPQTMREARFTTNAGIADVNKLPLDTMSGVASLGGYSRGFYRELSMVSLQYRCHVIHRRTVTVRLDARVYTFGPLLASFNHVTLPAGFVRRANELAARHAQRAREPIRKALGTLSTLLGPDDDKPSTEPNNQR